MAVTKLWEIRDSIGRVIRYAKNPEKTEYSDLAKALHYAGDGHKTEVTDEKAFLVTGVKCRADHALEDMLAVQERYGKTGGIVAYHAYQSFKSGEVTPKQCHDIGVELAQRLWGGSYQVLVATHLNTDCCHNHFVINSVSLVNGKKMQQRRSEYYRLRDMSDRICKEHELSVVNHPDGRTPRCLYIAEKNGEPTKYNLMREAIDNAIAHSNTPKAFMLFMRKSGYVISSSENRKYDTIRAIGDTKNTRMYRLGADYESLDVIIDKVNRNWFADESWRWKKESPPPSFSVEKLFGIKAPVGWLHGLYLHYCYLLGALPKGNTFEPYTPQMKEELRRLDRTLRQVSLLSVNGIETIDDLGKFAEQTQNKISELSGERQKLRNILRRAGEPEVIKKTKEQISALTEQITPLRQKLRTAKEIEARVPVISERVELEESFRGQMRGEYEKQILRQRGGYER